MYLPAVQNSDLLTGNSEKSYVVNAKETFLFLCRSVTQKLQPESTVIVDFLKVRYAALLAVAQEELVVTRAVVVAVVSADPYYK